MRCRCADSNSSFRDPSLTSEQIVAATLTIQALCQGKATGWNRVVFSALHDTIER